jgi:hypothetical protein
MPQGPEAIAPGKRVCGFLIINFDPNLCGRMQTDWFDGGKNMFPQLLPVFMDAGKG